MAHASVTKLNSWNVFPAHSTAEFILLPESKMGCQPHHTLEPQRLGHVLKRAPDLPEQLQVCVVKEIRKSFKP